MVQVAPRPACHLTDEKFHFTPLCSLLASFHLGGIAVQLPKVEEKSVTWVQERPDFRSHEWEGKKERTKERQKRVPATKSTGHPYISSYISTRTGDTEPWGIDCSCATMTFSLDMSPTAGREYLVSTTPGHLGRPGQRRETMADSRKQLLGGYTMLYQ